MSSTPAVQADIRTVTSHRSDLNSLASTNNGIANGMDDNSESSESTSGCSSLIPQINRHEGPSNLLYSSTFTSRKRHLDDKLTFSEYKSYIVQKLIVIKYVILNWLIFRGQRFFKSYSLFLSKIC